MSCAHLKAQAGSPEPAPQVTQGCQECLEIGYTDWIHLRLCLDCGHVGCCDSSRYKHATGHYAQTSHPVMRSFQPGESWRWCFVDEVVD